MPLVRYDEVRGGWLIRHLAAFDPLRVAQRDASLGAQQRQRQQVGADLRRGRLGQDQPQAHAAVHVSARIDPVAADPGVGVGDHHPNRAVRLGRAAVLGHEALAVLVVIEILLPQIAQLEDPVIARWRREVQQQGLAGRLFPGAEAMMPVGDAAIAQVQRAAEADAVRALRQFLLPPRAHQFQVGEHQLAALGQLGAEVIGAQRLGGRMIESLDAHDRSAFLGALVVHHANQEAHAVGLDLQPVARPRGRLGTHQHLEVPLRIKVDRLALQHGGGAQQRGIAVLEPGEAAGRPVARARIVRLCRGPRCHDEVGCRAARAADHVAVAAVDELRQQVILVGRLKVDGLPPRRIAQARALRLAVLHEALKTIAGEAREEAVPLGAIQRRGLLAEALNGTAGEFQHLAVIFPGAAGQETLRALLVGK